MSEFRPLFAPQVKAPEPKPAEPVTWFKVIAPTFPEAAVPPQERTTAQQYGGGVQAAVFGSIDAVAETERLRQLRGQPEPEDVLQLRRDAAEEARAVVAEAHEQARVILEASREEGYKAGYLAGTASGRQEAIRQLTQRADDERQAHQHDLSAFISYMEETSRRAWVEMEPEIVALVFEIARKVIKMEVEINREAAIEVVKNTLRRVADTTSLRIRVHADDLQTVRANREELFTLVDNIRQVEVVEDRRVGPGGCIVETEAGTIDARIETQLEEIRKLLEQATIDRGA